MSKIIRRPRKPPLRGKFPAQWRRERGVSASTWYAWRRKGIAPKVVQPAGRGGRGVILPEDERAWDEQYATTSTAAE